MTCAYCRRETERSESHHVAGAANAPRLKIQTCPDCHPGLTGCQLDAGILLDHEAARDEHDRGWALVHGLSELVVAPADDDEPRARTIERLTLTAGRVIDALADHPIGPDPIGAAARETVRVERHPGPAEPTIENQAESFAAILATVGQAWSGELRRPLGVSLDEEAIASLLRRLGDTDGAAMILRDLTAILGRLEVPPGDFPRLLDDLDRIEGGVRVILDLLGRVASAESDESAAAILRAVS